MSTPDYIMAVALMTLITFGQKSLPFIALDSWKNSRVISYLATWLPPSVMFILAIYALRMQWFGFSKLSIAPVIACITTTIIHIILRHVLLSIVVGVLTFSLFNNFLN